MKDTVCAKPCTPLSVRPAHHNGRVAFVASVSFAKRGASAFCVAAAAALNEPTDQGASSKYFASSARHAQPANPGP